jgi:hypothetical protein
MTTDIVNNIDERLGELQGEIAKLESARIALLDGASPKASPQASPQPRRARRKPVKPIHEVVPAGKLKALLSGSKGLTTRELASSTNGEQRQILSLLREMESDDQVRRSGQRRGTHWHLITDEDRISARVAELKQTR